MPITGSGLYRGALAFEILANTFSLPYFFLYPTKALSFFVSGPAMITPATETLTQWFGSIIVALTVPLLLSWKNPSPGAEGERQIGLRRLTYIVLGAGEIALIAAITLQYFSDGDKGMTNTALLMSIANLAPLLVMRFWFMMVKPTWMEGPERASKAKSS